MQGNHCLLCVHKCSTQMCPKTFLGKDEGVGVLKRPGTEMGTRDGGEDSRFLGSTVGGTRAEEEAVSPSLPWMGCGCPSLHRCKGARGEWAQGILMQQTSSPARKVAMGQRTLGTLSGVRWWQVTEVCEWCFNDGGFREGWTNPKGKIFHLAPEGQEWE
jgi:hypothetical protein